MISRVERLDDEFISISFQAESAREAKAMKVLWHNSMAVRTGDKVTISVCRPFAQAKAKKK